MIYILLFLNIYSFNSSRAIWQDRRTTVYFSSVLVPTNAQQLKDDLDSNGVFDWIDEVKKGFNRWLEVNGVDFELEYSDFDCAGNCQLNNGKNEIYWVIPDNFNYPYPDRALGITFRYKDAHNWTEADIVLNKNFDIALISGEQDSNHRGFCILGSNLGGGPYTGCYDFPSVITHEIGHFFGLEHPSEDPNIDNSDYRKQDLMYYTLSYSETLLPLKDDDIDGIYCLYPEGEDSFSVDECCANQNVLIRPEVCSHNFSSVVKKSLIAKDSMGGCGIIQDTTKRDKMGWYFNILFFFPLIFLLLRRQKCYS